jgi:ubiquinone/menaquinone biosynthesis C-methylase UbiE
LTGQQQKKALKYLEEDEFARALLAHERRDWQNPDQIVDEIGVRRGMFVADLACGPGFFVVPLARKVGESGRVYAVDKSGVMLNYLRSTLDRAKVNHTIVNIIEADATHTRIPSSKCEVVLFANVLHDIEARNEFLSEVKRIAKIGAKVVDIDWGDMDSEIGPPRDIRLSESKSLEILKNNGLELDEKIKAGPYHYGLVLHFS